MPTTHLTVTGAPWVDDLRIAPRGSTARPTVLVALSGPGNTIGEAEHQSLVRRIVEGCLRTPEFDWRFRLHLKDSATYYETAFAAAPPTHAQLVPASAARSIHEDLDRSSVMITVGSAAALDMLHAVPVVTLARTDAASVPDFVRAGATHHVETNQPLAERLRTAVETDARSPTRTSAAAYIARSFGQRDGRATRRVAEALVDMIRRHPCAAHP